MKTTKLELVKEYCYKHLDTDKKQLIKDIMKKFTLAKSSAETYYYEWKAEYLETEDCIPSVSALSTKKTPRSELARKKMVILDNKKLDKEQEGKYINYTLRRNGVEVNGILFRNKKDLESFRKEQFKIAYQQLGEIESLLEGMGCN